MEDSFDTICVNSKNGAIKVKLLSATNTIFSKRLMWTREDVVSILQRFMICQFILFVVSIWVEWIAPVSVSLFPNQKAMVSI